MTVDDLVIRPFRERDRAAVVTLWERIFPDDPPWNAPLSIIRRKLTVQPDLFLVGSAEGRVIGTVLAGFDGVRGWVYHLAVDPSCRRLGVGTRLMRAAESGLAQLGCPKVNLQVRAANTEVIEFYRAIGYQIEDRVSMGKRLGEAE